MAERFEDGFAGRVAVLTGGGTGMGRELVRQLAAMTSTGSVPDTAKWGATRAR